MKFLGIQNHESMIKHYSIFTQCRHLSLSATPLLEGFDLVRCFVSILRKHWLRPAEVSVLIPSYGETLCLILKHLQYLATGRLFGEKSQLLGNSGIPFEIEPVTPLLLSYHIHVCTQKVTGRLRKIRYLSILMGFCLPVCSRKVFLFQSF